VMQDGIVEQIGSPMELYNDPDNLFVAGFIGSPAMNFLDANSMNMELSPDVKTVGFRPEAVTIGNEGQLAGTISHLEHLGADTNVYVHIDDTLVTIREVGETQHEVGASVKLGIPQEKLYRFAADGKRIR
nr:TOBE domain-containing protein [Gammaproteobacteria bacterium]